MANSNSPKNLAELDYLHLNYTIHLNITVFRLYHVL